MLHCTIVTNILKFFSYEHLPPNLQDVSRPFNELAHKVACANPDSPETAIALRKLLEAKDAAVRAMLSILVFCGILYSFTTANILAAELTIAGDNIVQPYKLVKLRAIGVDDKAGLLWQVAPDKEVSKSSYSTDDSDTLEFVAPPGAYEVSLISARLKPDGKTVLKLAKRTIIIGTPPGPTPPPGPIPDPTPTPTPGPAPIPDKGFRVLVVYESSEIIKLDPKQIDVLYSAAVADYLNKKCVMGPMKSEWRMWDKDTNYSGEGKVWQDAMKRQEEGVGDKKVGKRTTLPWVIISNGTTGYEGPLPKTVDDMLILLKKYGE